MVSRIPCQSATSYVARNDFEPTLCVLPVHVLSMCASQKTTSWSQVSYSTMWILGNQTQALKHGSMRLHPLTHLMENSSETAVNGLRISCLAGGNWNKTFLSKTQQEAQSSFYLCRAWVGCCLLPGRADAGAADAGWSRIAT